MSYVKWKCPKCSKKNELHTCPNCEIENKFKHYYGDFLNWFVTIRPYMIKCKNCGIIYRSIRCSCGCVMPVKKCDLA